MTGKINEEMTVSAGRYAVRSQLDPRDYKNQGAS